MSAGVLIRRALATDAELLLAIERSSGEAFRAVPDLAWIADDDVMSAEQHAHLMANGAVWVATRNARLVGFISAEMAERHWHIWQMAVEREEQGRGVGRALLDTLAQAARASGVSTVTLTTFRDVPWNAPFYARSGFRIVAPDDLNERLRDVLANEIAHGLPGEQRCAMTLKL